MAILNKINNRHIVFLFVVVMILSFAIFEKSAKAQYWGFVYGLTPGDEIYSDILYNPSIERIDLNAKSIIDSANIGFIIDPGGAYGLRINNSSTMDASSTWAAEFEGNVEIHGGDLTLNGAIIQANSSTSILNFPGFTDTPDAYLTNDTGGTDTGFAKRTIITIHNEKVMGTNDLEKYPFLFSGRYDMLKHRDWGGHISSTVGADIAFSWQEDPNAAADKFYKHELMHYNSTTGDIIVWLTPTALYNSDTLIYFFYGNVDEGPWTAPDETWDNYGGVYHMNDAQDASMKNDGTFNHTPVTEDDFVITTTSFPFSAEYSQEFDGSGDYITVPSPTDWYDGNGVSVSAWIKVDNWTGWPGSYSMISIDDNSSQQSFHLWHDDNNLYWEIFHGNNGKYANTISVSHDSISEGDWHYISASYDKNQGYQGLFIDGVNVAEDTSVSSASSLTNSTADLHIGGGITGYSDFDGYIDEVRIVKLPNNSIYGADIDQTMINNYLSPGTFFTVDVSDVGKILSVSTTEADVGFETDNNIYTDLIRSLWEVQSSFEIYFNTGDVVIGTGTPTGLLNLFSDTGTNAQIDLTSDINDTWSIYNDESSNDLRLWNTNQVSGVNNMLLTTGADVGIGTNTVNDNLTLAGKVYFIQSNASNTLAVYNYAADGIAIYGEGFWAIEGVSSQTLGVGITGQAEGADGVGVYGIGKVGVYGKNELGLLLGAGIEGRDSFYGGYFTTDDVGGAALYGRSDQTYAGILGENTRTDGGYGVIGEGRYGVYGIATLGAGIKGIATTSFTSYAGYFEGDLALGRYDSGTPVYLDLYDDINPPDSADCDEVSEYGRTMLETTNHKLYVCDDTGWKMMTLYLPSICGDGVTEGEEVCDDGDLVTEGCGNDIKEVGIDFCNSDCTLEYDLNEACDYMPQGNDCALVPGQWTMRTGKTFNSYCRTNCEEIMFSCVAP